VQTVVPGNALATPPPADPAKPPEGTPAAPVVVDAKWRPKAVEGLKRDDAIMSKTAEVFAKHGLNDAQAQALVEYSDELGKLGAAAQEKAEAEAAKTQHATWWKELEQHKELGGAKFKENLAVAAKGAKALFGPDGIKAIEEAGLSNWPPLVAAMYRAGSKISEDTLQDGNRAAPPVPDDLAKLKAQYPKSPQLWDPTHPEYQGARK
jgi:hypothetical protein